MEKLSNEQLISRLTQFSQAHSEALAFEDEDYARECSDVVSIIRELMEARTIISGKPTGDVAPVRERATFVDIPMLPRSGVTTTAISILKAERQAGKNAFIATTHEQAGWLSRYRGVAPAWMARIGDLGTLSTANVIIVDDAEYMEVMFSKIFPRAGGLRAYLSVIGSARVYWLTSGK